MRGTFITALASTALLPRVLGASTLSTNGFTNCNNGTSTITVNNLDISFDKSSNNVTFDVSGSSEKSQEVIATLTVTAYGQNIYTNTFDPCSSSTYVDQLCPVPAGTFSAAGEQQIPEAYATDIPSIAYTIPDLDGFATMTLKAKDGGQQVACVSSSVTNGKSVEVPAVSYVAAAIAAGALAVSLLGAAASGGHPGATHSSPSFTEVMWWFQGLAMNGMHSVNYPGIYRSFSKNFAFSTGLFPWASMQNTIDSFRAHTGGNLTDDNYQYLKNSTLVFPDGTTGSTTTNLARRGLDLLVREVTTNINGTSSGTSNSTTTTSKSSHLVSGIEAYTEQLTIPQANTFMTVLLIFAVIVAAIVVGILLFKVILETWALFGTFPRSMTTFRKEYWRVMAQTITSLVLLLYGTWTLYCIFQFTRGDSWAAKLLAGLTLGSFTGLLAFYTIRIFIVARQHKYVEGESSTLYTNKEIWKKYRLFYENYKHSYYWLFVPSIIYMFAKGCVLAAGDGHGMVQTVGQLIIESLMLMILLWSRPFMRKSGNWINIIIQIVRVLSVVCILVFVTELGISQTTKTITGVVLIVVQSALTAILAILIAVNSLITCFRENPHRKRRKAAEQAALRKSQDLAAFEADDDDAFMMQPRPYTRTPVGQKPLATPMFGKDNTDSYEPVRRAALAAAFERKESQDRLVNSAASMGSYRDESPHSWTKGMEPRLPDIDLEDHGGRLSDVDLGHYNRGRAL